ncbi:MAG: S-methyl-5'-thioadenosine phosphorylase [Myxococcales bacterium]|nr:S-methyl-5'-thioadenosine phosphorylase [Myxococcales bacterium]
MSSPMLGIIGGSGLYEMPDLEHRETVELQTPYGLPSDDITKGMLQGQAIAFLPRHGKNHQHLPAEVPYRANLWALKSMGCDYVLSVSAGGSLQEHIAPGELVLVDQYIDRTSGRAKTYFGEGVVGHVPFADPICPYFHGLALRAAQDTDVPSVHQKGTYICIDGPTFSTRAESRLFRQWGADCVGMTNLPEARLAREAEMSYASAILITDWDCWKDRDDVEIEAIMQVLRDNVKTGQQLVRNLAGIFATEEVQHPSPQQGAAKFSIVTQKESIPSERRKALELFYRTYLN